MELAYTKFRTFLFPIVIDSEEGSREKYSLVLI